jgi:hypothetical protein
MRTTIDLDGVPPFPLQPAARVVTLEIVNQLHDKAP